MNSFEKELTCSICTDLLYDPVTFLDCLHTNCGSCAKSWFQSLSNNAANSQTPAAVPKYTCPVCRSTVRATKHNSTLQSLLEDFIGRNPDKDRTSEEKIALRKVYTPGSGVLPGESGSSSSASFVPPAMPNRRPVPQNVRPAPSSSWSAPALNTNGGNTNRNNSAGPSSRPRHYWRGLALNPEKTCFHCQKRVDYAVCCRCPQCNIITCTRCYRNGKNCRDPAANHALVMQKLQVQPRRHIQSGVFCDICETWCDNSEGLNSFFWSCGVCDNGSWSICRTCVSKGNSCSHELVLYTNNRPPSTNGFVVGNTGEDHYQIFQELAHRAGSMNIDLHTQLSASGYIRSTNFTVICDNCRSEIPPDHSYLHCMECMDSQWDMCMACWYTYMMADNIGEGDDGSFKCRFGHQMSLLSQNGQKGTHKTIQGIPHDPPDYVAKTPVVGGEAWWEVNPGPKTAVAIKPHWPETVNPDIDTVYTPDTPGIRPRDFDGLLGFPEKAEISNVWVAFTESYGDGVVEYLWGWYAGVGGLFPRDCVRFID